jgi:hypothetical protein
MRKASPGLAAPASRLRLLVAFTWVGLVVALSSTAKLALPTALWAIPMAIAVGWSTATSP